MSTTLLHDSFKLSFGDASSLNDPRYMFGGEWGSYNGFGIGLPMDMDCTVPVRAMSTVRGPW